MPEYKGLPYLQNKLRSKRLRVLTRYKYYEMKNLVFDFGISTPPDLRYWNSTVGWCARAVDALADRLDFYEFRDDYFNLTKIYDMNNRDILIESAILGALIASCSFIYVSEDDTGFPRLQVIDASDATGIVEPITGLLNEGYAVLERNPWNLPKKEAYFTYEWTAYYEDGKLVDVRANKAPYPLLVPIVFRPDAMRPFGHSRISRGCMSILGSALRTIKRSEISAEFYSFPQKWVTGLDDNAQQMDNWKAAMSAMMKFELNEDGNDHVKVGQFSTQTQEPHMEQLRMFASLFAGETGLTLDDLGFATENPSSAEAIKAAHENLRLTAKRAQKNFGSGLLNAGYLAACIRDDYKYYRQQLYLTKPAWYPPFAVDASSIGVVGDAVQKMQMAYPDYMTEDKVFDLVGI